MLPVQLRREGDDAILIDWDDGLQSRIPVQTLRRNCPCATCREKHSAGESKPASPLSLPVLSAAQARPLTILSMRPVGNYAYNIAFSDDHDSGIFTFDMLRELGSSVDRH